MPPRKRDVDQRQVERGAASRARHPPRAFARVVSTEALESIVESVALVPRSRAAHMRNWAGNFTSDAATHDGAFSHVSRRVFAPRTVEQVVAVVELARRGVGSGPVPLRAVGRLHSPSDLPFSLGWTVRTDELQGIVRVDAEHGEVCVLAGTYLSTLSDALRAHDPPLGLHNLGSISQQTVAGILATATHGSGVHFPVISADVRALELVCPHASGAEVVACSRAERPELFNATLCGLGATGIVVSVTLSVERAFCLRQVQEEVHINELLGDEQPVSSLAPEELAAQPYDTFFANPALLGTVLAQGVPLPPAPPLPPLPRSAHPAHVYPFVAAQPAAPLVPWNEASTHTCRVQALIETLVDSAEHVRLLWSPHAHKITVDRASRTDARAEPASVLASAYDRAAGHVVQALLFASRMHPSLPGPLMRTAYALMHAPPPRVPRDAAAAPGGLAPLSTTSAIAVRVDEAPAVFNFDCLFPQYTSEYAIPYEYTGAALLALRAWLDAEHARDDGVRLHFPVEVRFVDADGIWLSHCYGRRTCFIGIVQYRPYGLPVRYRKLFTKFEALMRQFHGRPHWAKTHTAYRGELARHYPHLADWQAVVREHDPARMLVNPYVARHLLDEHMAGRRSVFRVRL